MSDRHLSQPAASSEYDIKEMNAALDRRFANERKNGGMGSNNYFNGSTKFVNWMLGIIAALMVAAVCGMWGMFGKVEAMSVQVTDLKEKIDLVIAGKIRIPP